ncbi:hypothetical protein MLD38_029942 [Melastoma candidum]|uniref:Uncharacterized protein n=1 Tax=Melastoma candidum TaxID=119954 RepID=A0ACB9MLG2_9MYRT|nr:hypothetical protein MLD38_029942 [Melastoma candidum]
MYFFAATAADVPSSSVCCRNAAPFHAHAHALRSVEAAYYSSGVVLKVLSLRKGGRGYRPRRLRVNAASSTVDAARVVENAPLVEIPVTCYQLLGLADNSEKDEIVKSVIQLKQAQVEEGYTLEAIRARQDLLLDIRDKLLFEPEYAGNVREKNPPKSSLKLPLSWLAGALCLLQEVGEEKLVLNIGQAALQHYDAKRFGHDIVLSMALAECSIAKASFEKNKVSQGFEALARAQSFLRSRSSLGKMPLLAQIEESLEELAPACTLELLDLPRSPENVERRQGALGALCEMLRQGLDVEASARVQDWPCFLIQALSKLSAQEIVNLVSWTDVASSRKNKKSLESQSQRTVIDFKCFYLVMLAHIAHGFSSKQMELINRAKVICDCLVASEGIDLKFEEAFCRFLLGEGSEGDAIEKLKQLERNSNSSSLKALTGKEVLDASKEQPSLELWLKDAVLPLFADTKDCPPSLANFFKGERRVSERKNAKETLQTISTVNRRPLSSSVALNRQDMDDSLSNVSTSRHLISAVKQLSERQGFEILGDNASAENSVTSSNRMKRVSSLRHREHWLNILPGTDAVGQFIFVAILGSFTLFSFKLVNKNMRMFSRAQTYSIDKGSVAWTMDASPPHKVAPACIENNSIANKVENLVEMVKRQFKGSKEAQNIGISFLAASLSKRGFSISMPLEDAEALVRQWQSIKAEALGPDHRVHHLSEILDESMLDQWQDLAEKAKARSCYWRFLLLELSVLDAAVFSDGVGTETAEIEALLEEAAELVDESQPKNTNYCSSYKIHYVLKKQDGIWKFCKGDIQSPL